MKSNAGPKALAEYVLYQSKNKSDKCFRTLLVQGILAGMYIAIGAIGYFKVAGSVGDPGLASLFGAMVFPLGIIAVLLMHAELFTSDTMVMMAIYAKRTNFRKVIRILVTILLANFIGALFIAFLSETSQIYNAHTMEMIIEKAKHKVHMPIGQLLVSGILCNILVSTGVCLAYSCKEEIAKIAAIWLAITVFVLSGTEHVVANMYYLFAAYFGGADITLGQIFYNLSIAAIGNFIGGGIIVSGINYMVACKDIQKTESISELKTENISEYKTEHI